LKTDQISAIWLLFVLLQFFIYISTYITGSNKEQTQNHRAASLHSVCVCGNTRCHFFLLHFLFLQRPWWKGIDSIFPELFISNAVHQDVY